MTELKHACHCVYQIRYHMVFCIKYRKKILSKKDRVEFFKEICFEIGERYWFEFDAIGTDGDHVHIFVGAAPRYAPSRIMQIIKSITAKNIFKKYPDIKKQLGDGKVPVASIYLILAGLSAADVFHRPARLSLIPSLVAHEQLVKANSLIMASNQVIMAISYTVGGWLILAVPLRQIALYVIILFAMAALAAMFIVVPKRQEAKDASEKESFWKSLASGWNYLRQHPIARPLTIMETVEHLPHGIWTGALMLAFTTKALHGDASDWGYQVTSFFMGMILGSIGVLVISNWLTRYPGRIIVVNAFAAGLFTLAYAGSQTVLMAVACSFMFGPPVAIRDVAQDSLLQGTVERDQLGRVYATQEMLRNMAFMFACIFFAWLSDFVPIRLIYVIGGIMYLFTGAYALGNKALRESKMGTFIQPFEKMH